MDRVSAKKAAHLLITHQYEVVRRVLDVWQESIEEQAKTGRESHAIRQRQFEVKKYQDEQYLLFLGLL